MEDTSNRENDWRINRAQITLFHTRLYHNGGQQVRVRLYVEPMLNGVIVRLSPSERENIRLTDYDTPEGDLPFNDHDPSLHYVGWSAQRNYRGYTFYPDIVQKAGVVEPAQGGGETVDFYLSANDLARARTPLRISFSIYGDDGSIWRTTGHVTFADGSHAYIAHLDLREDISLTVVTPVLYSADNFQLDRSSIMRDDPHRSAPLFNDKVTVSIVAAGGRVVGIHDMECVPAGMIHWINNLPTTSNPCFTGYARPRQTGIRWNMAVPTGSQPLPESLPAPEPTKGTIVLCGRIDIPRGYDPMPVGPVAMHITDEYGTLQTHQLAFVDGKRDELVVR